MKILYLTNNPNLGSTARILQSWLEMGRADQNIGVVILPREGDLAEWLRTNGVPHRIDSMPWPDRKDPLKTAAHTFMSGLWAFRQRIDLIHCNEHDVYPFGLILRRILRRPLVCHVRFRVTRQFCDWAFGGEGRVPDALLWTSRRQREDCRAAVTGIVPDDRQHTVSLGMNLDRFGALADGRDDTRSSWGVRPEEIVIGTASSFKPIKRLEDFIDIVSILAQEDDRVIGVIAGDAPPGEEAYREELRARICSKRLGRRLQWLGNLEPIEPFGHAIDIFISTSDYETFGNSVCEAMACRRPVAAYRGGSVEEVVGDSGRVVETGDFPALVDAVRMLVRDAGLRNCLGMQSRARVAQHFNSKESYKKLNKIFASLKYH
jgi:glycosyltransferase involved in cell wall biosynthesis